SPAKTVEAWAREKQSDLSDLRSALTGGTTDKAERGSDTLIGMAIGTTLFPEQTETLRASLKVLAKKQTETVGVVDPTSSHTYYTAKQHATKLIVVDAIANSHAEQNLAVSLLRSGYPKSGEVSIAGGKRPCAICYLSLCIVKERFTSLRFNPHAGGYFIGETKGGLLAIAEAMGLSDGEVAKRAEEYLGTGFT